MDTTHEPRRRWLSFNLRSLFVCVTLLAIALAYVAREQLQSRREQATVAAWQPHVIGLHLAGLCDLDRIESVCGPDHNPENDVWWRRSIAATLGPRVRQLNLESLPDGGLESLANLKHLKSLELYHVPIADFAPLSRLNTLETLELGGTNISDLSPLARLDKLRFLSLSGTPVNDLSQLARLPNLQDLYLTGTNVRELSPLSSLAQLETLFLDGTPVEEVEPLARLKMLTRLNIARTHVVDLSPLTGLSNLQMLDISGLEITPEQFSQLRRHLPNCKINIYGPDGAASTANPEIYDDRLRTP